MSKPIGHLHNCICELCMQAAADLEQAAVAATTSAAPKKAAPNIQSRGTLVEKPAGYVPDVVEATDAPAGFRYAGTAVMAAPGYDDLAAVFKAAFDQATVGKGAERHADSKPFKDQPMQLTAARRGIGFILGQADKKSEEAEGMLRRGERDKWEHEIMGAMVYLAGAIIFTRNNPEYPK